MSDNLLEMKGITKALSGRGCAGQVDFSVKHGEVHAFWRKWGWQIHIDQNLCRGS